MQSVTVETVLNIAVNESVSSCGEDLGVWFNGTECMYMT